MIRLLTRTTRSVSPTAAGERLLNAIGHRFDEIDAELDELTEMWDKPAGTVRITCGEHVLRATLLPKFTPLLLEYPDINYGFRDIVADRFDAGVRMGNTIDKDMIAVPIPIPIGPQFYPSRRQPSPVFSLVLNALCYSEAGPGVNQLGGRTRKAGPRVKTSTK